MNSIQKKIKYHYRRKKIKVKTDLPFLKKHPKMLGYMGVLILLLFMYQYYTSTALKYYYLNVLLIGAVELFFAVAFAWSVYSFIQLMRSKAGINVFFIIISIVAILLFWSFRNTAYPLFKDIPNALSKNFSIASGKCSFKKEVSGAKGDRTLYFDLDGKRYCLNGWANIYRFYIEENNIYLIKYLPNSGMIIDVEQKY